MKDLIKNWQLISLLLIVVMLLSMIVGSRCSRKQSETGVNQTEQTQERDRLIDSIQSIPINEKIIKIDSANKILSKKVESLKVEKYKLQATIKTLSEENNRLKEIYTQTPTLEKCDSVVNSQAETIEVQRDLLTITEQEAQTWCEMYEGSEQQLELKDTLLTKRTDMLNRANVSVDRLQKQLKKENNWFRKNEKWIFFAGGAIITGYILR